MQPGIKQIFGTKKGYLASFQKVVSVSLLEIERARNLP